MSTPHNLMLIIFLKVLHSIIGSSFLDSLFFKVKMKSWALFSGIAFLKEIHILAIILSTFYLQHPVLYIS